MDIKRIGPGNIPPDNASVRKNSPATKPFGESLSAGRSESADAAPGVAPGVTRADLADEARADAAVQHCVGELIDVAGGRLGVPLSAEDRERISEVLKNDPGFRAEVMQYLDQVLK